MDKYVKHDTRYSIKRYYSKRQITEYFMIVKTKDGSEIKHPVSFGVFREIHVGDSVVKKKGELYPEKVSAYDYNEFEE